MLLLGVDFETTGLNPELDRVIETGIVIWDTRDSIPVLVAGSLLWDDNFPPLSDEIIKLTGIKKDILDTFSIKPKAHYQWLSDICKKYNIEYLVGHNSRSFDKKFLEKECSRFGIEPPKQLWLDTMLDIDEFDQFDSRKLKYLALDHAFINPFAHRAIFDILTTLKILSFYDINKVILASQSPEVIVRALVPHPKEDNGSGKDFAKSLGYRWQDVDGERFDYCWVKKIKLNKFEAEKAKLGKYSLTILK